jgi:hypothetical protein
MIYNARFSVVLSLFTLFTIIFSHPALAIKTPAGQDKLLIHTGTPKRNGDSLFSFTAEWRVDEGSIYRGTGLLFIKGPDQTNPTTDVQIAKQMVSALNDGMVPLFPSWRGVLPEYTPDKPEVTLSNKAGYSFTSITVRDYANQKLTYEITNGNFNSADISVAIDLVLAASVDYIEGFTVYKPSEKEKHQGSIEISIGDDKPIIIKTNNKTTAQLEQEIASALGKANFSTEPLFPNLKDGDTRNHKPFDGSEVQLTNIAASTITIDINDQSLGVLTKFKFKDTNQPSDVFNPMTIIILLGLVVAGYFGYSFYQTKKQHNSSS